MVPLSLLFVTDMFLVCRVSDCLRGVLPPGVLGLRRMFAMVSEACLVLPVVGMASIVMVDVEDVSLVYPPVRLRRGDLLVLPLCRRVREATSGHFLHQSLGGRDGDPVPIVDGNVQEPAAPRWIAVLQCPSLELNKHHFYYENILHLPIITRGQTLDLGIINLRFCFHKWFRKPGDILT